jgi:phospholipid/cholesterol/gamma-HCH transport system substrate-binding protein
LKATLANVNKLSESFIETEKKLDPILAKADNFADSLQALQLKQTLGNVNKTIQNLQHILADINSGKGSLGKLTSDEALYSNVNKTTTSLEKLLTDFRENPKRYVHFSLFGRKDKPVTTLPASTTITTVTPADSTKM